MNVHGCSSLYKKKLSQEHILYIITIRTVELSIISYMLVGISENILTVIGVAEYCSDGWNY